MASLKDIRTRILSVKSTRKITSAMKVVSAAKFHKAVEQQLRFQYYMERFQEVMALALRHSGNLVHPLLSAGSEDGAVAVVVLASNSSLCGAYNTNVVTSAVARLKELAGLKCSYELYAYGKRAIEGLVRAGYSPLVADVDLVDKPTFAQVLTLFDTLSEAFLSGRYSRVEVVYNHFHNAAVQEPRVRCLLPIELNLPVKESKHLEYIFEPTPQKFFDYTLPQFGRLLLNTMVFSNYVGEHGARMTAMTQATDNADSLIEDLTLEYNKARQSAITNEILEIVSGSNALKQS